MKDKYRELPREQQLSYVRECVANDLCQAAREAGIPVSELDQRTYRRWWLRRPARCHMPTDVCVLFGTWDRAKEHAAAAEE